LSKPIETGARFLYTRGEGGFPIPGKVIRRELTKRWGVLLLETFLGGYLRENIDNGLLPNEGNSKRHPWGSEKRLGADAIKLSSFLPRGPFHPERQGPTATTKLRYDLWGDTLW